MLAHSFFADPGHASTLASDALDAVPLGLCPTIEGHRGSPVRKHTPVGRQIPEDDPAPESSPLNPEVDPDNPDLEDFPELDDSHWDAFVPDDDECDPEPEPGDFWTEVNDELRTSNGDKAFSSRRSSSFVICL